MGRELVRQLAAEGCHVSTCDVSSKTLAETVRLCRDDGLPQGVRVTTHIADVSNEAQVLAFRDATLREHEVDHVDFLFNNAGIGGGGSLFTDTRANWERTFNVCWGGVYLCTRAFLPFKSQAGHIVNTSSVNGFYASIGPTTPHTAYSAAKFAVKGFTEALITDLKVNAPNVKCSVVMPGHIGTDIVANSRKVLAGRDGDDMSAEEIQSARIAMRGRGVDDAAFTDAMVAQFAGAMADAFRDNAPMTAAAAAKVIIEGVREERWRILVGEDAHRLDEVVRSRPDEAYDLDFFSLFPSAPPRAGSCT
jgi:NAD(P)-dependent dehydrogenase (short-subunit alcohol dehydrogenase family)